MKYLEELHKLKLFNKNAVALLTKDKNAAKEILRKYKQRGLIVQIKRDLYAVTDLATKATKATRFEIAGNISPTSYLSYHSAMEYYGFANQIFNEMYISSVERFLSFDFDGMRYNFVKSYNNAGVLNPFTDSFVRLTDLERTIVDCLNRIDLCGGLDELVQCFSLITLIDEKKLLEYMYIFDKQFLFQKAGFVLSYFSDTMRLSDEFFETCKSKIGKSTRYLTARYESDTFFKEWNLAAPENILSYLEQGETVYV